MTLDEYCEAQGKCNSDQELIDLARQFFNCPEDHENKRLVRIYRPIPQGTEKGTFSDIVCFDVANFVCDDCRQEAYKDDDILSGRATIEEFFDEMASALGVVRPQEWHDTGEHEDSIFDE